MRVLRLRTAETERGTTTAAQQHEWLSRIAAGQRRDPPPVPAPPAAGAEATALRTVLHARATDAGMEAGPLPAIAYVNHGRWVADCPEPRCDRCGGPCGGAMDLLNADDPEGGDTDNWYLCGCCFNAGLGGQWRPLVWPDQEMIAAVEAALLARPRRTTQNWAPGETPEDLHAENVAHGHPPSVSVAAAEAEG